MVMNLLLHRSPHQKPSLSSSRAPTFPSDIPARRSGEERPSVLPHDEPELQRLIFHHRMLYTQFHRHFFAPIEPSAIHRILDVGCASGAWLFDLATLFPEASLTGVDHDVQALARTHLLEHPSCALVYGDVLEGLPFADGSFEYTHMRCMALAIPAQQWPVVIRELVRVTTAGGWIELFEGGHRYKHVGPHLHQMLTWTEQALKPLGFHLEVIDDLSTLLRQAGVKLVQEQRLDLPIGSWAGRAGALMAKNLLALFDTLKAFLVSSLSLSPQRVDAVLRALPHEWNTYHTTSRYLEIHGQCPQAHIEKGAA